MSDLLVGLLGGGGIASIVAAIIAGLFSKRKLGAEATKIITDAASGVVSDIRQQRADDKAAWDAEKAEYEQKVTSALTEASTCRAELARVKASWRAEREDWRRVLQLHVAFDHMAIAALREKGIELGDPPPLLPPLPAELED